MGSSISVGLSRQSGVGKRAPRVRRMMPSQATIAAYEDGILVRSYVVGSVSTSFTTDAVS